MSKLRYKMKLFFIGGMGLFLSFTRVAAGEIKIIEPGTDYHYVAGATVEIKWTVSGEVQPFLKINLLDSEGRLIDKISGGTPRDKNFKWRIPVDLEEGNYRLKVFTNDMSSEGTSGIFHIKPGKKRSSQKGEKEAKENKDGTELPSSFPEPGSEELPRPDSPRPSIYDTERKAVHKGVLVTPVVKFDDVKLEEMIRNLIKKPAPGTIFSSDFRKLTSLTARDSGIEKISGMEYFDSLVTLDLGGNNITSVKALGVLKKLKSVRLDHNRIEDLTPLADNESLGPGATVVLTGNPIDCQQQAKNIALLRQKGVKLEIDCP